MNLPAWVCLLDKGGAQRNRVRHDENVKLIEIGVSLVLLGRGHILINRDSRHFPSSDFITSTDMNAQVKGGGQRGLVVNLLYLGKDSWVPLENPLGRSPQRLQRKHLYPLHHTVDIPPETGCDGGHAVHEDHAADIGKAVLDEGEAGRNGVDHVIDGQGLTLSLRKRICVEKLIEVCTEPCGVCFKEQAALDSGGTLGICSNPRGHLVLAPEVIGLLKRDCGNLGDSRNSGFILI